MRWAPVEGFEGIYEVSDQGQVRRCASKPARFHLSLIDAHPLPNGYLQVGLRRPGEKKVHAFVHRLVGQAFIANPSNLPEINHKDGKKTNNAWPNLEWSSRAENETHKTRTLRRYKRMARVALMAPWGEVVFVSNFSHFAEVVGCSPTSIWSVANDRQASCFGFRKATDAEAYREIECHSAEDRCEAVLRRPPQFRDYLRAEEMAA